MSKKDTGEAEFRRAYREDIAHAEGWRPSVFGMWTNGVETLPLTKIAARILKAEKDAFMARKRAAKLAKILAPLRDPDGTGRTQVSTKRMGETEFRCIKCHQPDPCACRTKLGQP